MSDVMQGIEQDVVFDHATCEALANFCTNTASLVDGQAGSRAGAVSTGSTDFQGRFSRIFQTNAETAARDRGELTGRLRELATFARELADQARAEQQRREKAREWKRQQDDRNTLELIGDFFTGAEDPPVGPPNPPLSRAAASPAPAGRENPQPGGGGSGGGTSSARPDKLRSFATTSSGLNQELSGKPGELSGKLADFAARCQWGTLDGSGVVSGFTRWNQLNEQDVTWATVVAQAFQDAGTGSGGIARLSDAAIDAALRGQGVDSARDDITIDPAIAIGNPPTTGYANDPVNTATGNFLENELDLGFGTGSSTLSLSRTYNSFDQDTGSFGPGWTSWPECRIELDDQAARLRLPDGRTVVFNRLGAGWDRADGENLWLQQEEGQLLVTDNAGRSWAFAPTGAITCTSAGPGTRVDFHREEGRLVRLRHERGRQITLHWQGDRVVSASTDDGRTAQYHYDEAGRLLAVDTPSGTRRYEWDETGLLQRVLDADGVCEVENRYDDQRRVQTQRSQHGRETWFSYLDGRVTVVADPDGSRANTWIHDRRGRLVGVVDTEGRRQSASYDRHGNPVVVTTRGGETTVHDHDERGRRIRTVQPNGLDLSFGYDAADRLVTVVGQAGATTVLEYPGDERNPGVVVDPEGGRTTLDWHRGLLQEIVDPTGVRVRFSYDAHGELVATTDALGRSARLERDAAGRVTAAITPSGARTTYCYDEHGHLAARRDPDGATWRFEHSAAGRLLARVDPLGARTVMELADDGSLHRTVDPLGRGIERRLDDLGNLAQATLPDGSSWGFVHDALSRLVQVVDPTGGVWQHRYDADGRVVASEDPTGVVEQVSVEQAGQHVEVNDELTRLALDFDPMGRLTRSEQTDGAAVVTSHDRCGRVVEQLDAEGGLTLIARDPAGRPVRVTDPTGAVTHLAYDECGMLACVTDPAGGRTLHHRGQDGRPVRVDHPDGTRTWSRYDACGRVVAHHRPGRGTIHLRWDLAGRLVQLIDPWHGRRRFRYDAAGQLVEAVNALGGVTRYRYDANGRNVELVDPLGNTTRREFDAMNRCTAETDPLDRTTRAGYDAAGRLLWQQQADGARIEFHHDASGRPAGTSVDGRVCTQLERDVRHRRIVVTDHSDAQPVRHELQWDRCGRLVRRVRDGQETRWEFDAAGRRTAMTTPDGLTTHYRHDGGGQLVEVEHPLLGRAVLVRDAAGRVVEAQAGGTRFRWAFHDGFLTGLDSTGPDGTRSTRVRRDEQGRIRSVTDDDATTAFQHDDAGQLVAQTTIDDGGTLEREWRYDAAGRLVDERTGTEQVRHEHDAAGQLLRSTGAAGEVSHDYDAVGRRTASRGAGWARDYGWTALGRLTSVTTHRGERVQRVEVHVDALGELVRVGDVGVSMDSAVPGTPRPAAVGDSPVVQAGPLTGFLDHWGTDWRGGRDSGADPWQLPGAASLPGGISLGGHGEVVVAGLELLGARAYSAADRSFLSVDPLEPLPGAAWSGNPYSYAGNDPVHQFDPSGQRPVTEAELQAYRDSHNGALAATGEWFSNNWEYVAGGAMVVAGGALIATGVGGPVGTMLIAGGVDTIVQKATTGHVNPWQVAFSTATGAWGGVGVATRLGVTGVAGKTVVGGMIAGGTTNAAWGAGSYLAGPGPHTAQGLVGTTASSGVMGVATGGVGAGIAHGSNAGAVRLLSRTQVVPEQTLGQEVQQLMGNPGDTVVLGRLDDTAVAREWPEHVVLNTPNWTMEVNDEFINQTIAYQRPVYLASPFEGNMVQTTGRYAGEPTVYARELDMLRNAGYVFDGDYMVPSPPKGP